MAKILLKEYACRRGVDAQVAAHKAQRGTLPTAEKIGRDWWIDEDAEYTDARLKSGAYTGWRKKRRDDNADT